EVEKHHPSYREQRFNNFASVEFHGHVFMTPRDFLESITYDNPRYRTGRLKLNRAGVEKLLKSTPSRRKNSSQMFRNLSENGLISFTEYLFLLCVLTKPKSGFKIAFNMFDIDGDEKVDKKEFLVLYNILKKDSLEQQQQQQHQQQHHHHTSSSSSSSDVPHDHPSSGRQNIWQLIQNDDKPITETTLTVHFFGPKGKDYMNYKDFHRFMDNLQTEVLELEFAEFSSGLSTISEIEFAQILLRYTKLTKEEHDKYLNRLRNRIEHSQGIKFKDFKEFSQFLNSIDDFSLAMRIFTYADHPISEADFARAVKACTGQTLNSHMIHVVFQLFDVDGDGRLSHKEFISVMKERMHRGSKHMSVTRWDNFKACVKNDLR
ncbi:hypothetical protein HELRODRAFT_79826, partial [Helobdella robusta]|uniref:EF-hand domain-containing protein n=1 Tax=Helobdella robusta TaxID=6412 RepID=T1G3T9_HELRO